MKFVFDVPQDPAAGIDVHDVSDLPLTPSLATLDVGSPSIDGPITSEQEVLFRNHDASIPDEIFVYFVFACSGSLRGCASWVAPPEFLDASGLPVARPSVVVASDASLWTLAHECGHILGLSHVPEDSCLMYDTTSSLSQDPPDLTGQEAIIMQGSQFTQ